MATTELIRETGFCPPPKNLSLPPAPLPDSPSSSTSLPYMLMRIDQAVKAASPRLDVVLADILSDHAHDPDLLAGFDLAPSDKRYARHLIHQGAGYSVLAIVWMPGQMSPVHAHRTWCALAAHRGRLTETLFRHGRDSADPISGRQLFPGDVSHAHDLTIAHRIANLGVVPAISIHVYGAAYERLGQDVNHVWTA